MFHKTGTFNGIDICSDTIFSNFDLEYILSAEDGAIIIKISLISMLT